MYSRQSTVAIVFKDGVMKTFGFHKKCGFKINWMSIVVYLLKARTVEAEKQLLLGSACRQKSVTIHDMYNHCCEPIG
jgi:hypothetical protein